MTQLLLPFSDPAYLQSLDDIRRLRKPAGIEEMRRRYGTDTEDTDGGNTDDTPTPTPPKAHRDHRRSHTVAFVEADG